MKSLVSSLYVPYAASAAIFASGFPYSDASSGPFRVDKSLPWQQQQLLIPRMAFSNRITIAAVGCICASSVCLSDEEKGRDCKLQFLFLERRDGVSSWRRYIGDSVSNVLCPTVHA